MGGGTAAVFAEMRFGLLGPATQCAFKEDFNCLETNGLDAASGGSNSPGSF
jgi:hypothetical protein